MPNDERPPRAIWLQPKKINDHFEAVKKRREEKYGSPGEDKSIEDPVENEAARSLIVQ